MVERLLDSNPRGASVRPAAGGASLGTTPLKLRQRTSVQAWPLVLQLEGYEPRPVAIRFEANGSQVEILSPLPAVISPSITKPIKPRRENHESDRVRPVF
jgi:hypothetical protein